MARWGGGDWTHPRPDEPGYKYCGPSGLFGGRVPSKKRQRREIAQPGSQDRAPAGIPRVKDRQECLSHPGWRHSSPLGEAAPRAAGILACPVDRVDTRRLLDTTCWPATRRPARRRQSRRDRPITRPQEGPRGAKAGIRADAPATPPGPMSRAMNSAALQAFRWTCAVKKAPTARDSSARFAGPGTGGDSEG